MSSGFERYDVLFEPIRIGPKVMRNRFYQTPHDSGLGGRESKVEEAHFRGMKARGGWAAVSTGHVQVGLDFDFAGLHPVARICDDRDAESWSVVTDRIHAEGALAGIELGAAGAANSGYESRLPARSLSTVADDHFWMGSHYEMDKRDIRSLQRDYVAAAKRARDVGFDIVNVHGLPTWSICAKFLMPRFNHRTDEYGGSLENRARFWLETLELVREAVGEDCAITARHCLDTCGAAGELSIEEEGVGFVELADHLVDFWDLHVGHDPRDIGPSRFYGENAHGEWIARARPYTDKPIAAVGRFTSPDTMAAVIRGGQQDIIAAARASISDPFLPAKIEAGRIDEIRECIGCNVCDSRMGLPARIVCTQNPVAGEEYRRGWDPEHYAPSASADRSVLVVGAGPAGLECAITLARRGVEAIHLVDAEREVGGHFRWVPRLPGLAEWSRVIDYRKTMCEQLRNLAVVTNKRLSLDEILDYGADRVVLATGSHWARDGLNGITQAPIPGADAALDHVHTPEEVVADGADRIGQRVLVYDCEGYFTGLSISERLALEGREVIYVTPLSSPGPYLELTMEQEGMIARLGELGARLFSGAVIEEFETNCARGALRSDASQKLSWEADSFVLVTQRVPNSALFGDLTSDSDRLREFEISDVFRVGDCLAPRPQVADAIFDAHRLAREIDADDPATPLAPIRTPLAR